MQTTEALPGHYFGTGDMFASVLAGRLLQGRPLQTAIASAMDFIARAIAVTNQAAEADNPLQDVNFGPVLPTLAAASTRAESEERP
jgi:pyridoxine kinase